MEKDKKVKFDFHKDFIEEWINQANVHKDSEIAKFFCYFIIFNYLYSSFGYQNCETEDSEFLSERKMISQLINYCYKSNRNRTFISPYQSVKKDSELRTYVRNMRPNKKYENIKYFQQLLDNEDINELFQNIYTIRCNLFHGAKSMEEYRDSQLIKDSNKVLSIFLNDIIKSY